MTIARILIVDHQPIYRHGLKHWLSYHYPSARVVCCHRYQQALKISRRWAPQWLFIAPELVADHPDHQLAQLLSASPSMRLFTLGFCQTALAHQVIDRQCPSRQLREQLACPQYARQVQLTPAQRRVLNGLLAGQINKQIASQLNIKEATIKAHLTEIYRKLGVANRTQALAKLHTQSPSAFD